MPILSYIIIPIAIWLGIMDNPDCHWAIPRSSTAGDSVIVKLCTGDNIPDSTRAALIAAGVDSVSGFVTPDQAAARMAGPAWIPAIPPE